MTLTELSYHTISERAQLVLLQGKLLLSRRENPCCVFLFHMGDFFAEIWYSLTDRCVVGVHAFEGGNMLEPYLAQIDVSELMQ